MRWRYFLEGTLWYLQVVLPGLFVVRMDVLKWPICIASAKFNPTLARRIYECDDGSLNFSLDKLKFLWSGTRLLTSWNAVNKLCSHPYPCQVVCWILLTTFFFFFFVFGFRRFQQNWIYRILIRILVYFLGNVDVSLEAIVLYLHSMRKPT